MPETAFGCICNHNNHAKLDETGHVVPWKFVGPRLLAATLSQPLQEKCRLPIIASLRTAAGTAHKKIIVDSRRPNMTHRPSTQDL